MAFKLTDGNTLELPNNKKAAARYVADMIHNRGHLPDSEEMVTWNEFVNVICTLSCLIISEKIVPISAVLIAPANDTSIFDPCSNCVSYPFAASTNEAALKCKK